MAKEVEFLIKLQIKGGAANPSPPVGPALGAKGVNIMEFCKQFNARTQEKGGKVLPVVISVYKDKSFDFVGLSFEEWQSKTGHDENSIITDPGTINTDEGTYTLKSGIAKEIGFTRFDPKEAGVYGSDGWKDIAVLPDSILSEFERAVEKNMKKPESL